MFKVTCTLMRIVLSMLIFIKAQFVIQNLQCMVIFHSLCYIMICLTDIYTFFVIVLNLNGSRDEHFATFIVFASKVSCKVIP